jgi:IMP cyclohydrolase
VENINIKCNDNINSLKNNLYPGRGIVVGMTPDSKRLVQLYWIMGRSENSRNRIFVNENGFIKTEPWKKEKVEDPSLIMYYAAKHHNSTHIVSNGDHTERIYDIIRQHGKPEDASNNIIFEPDKPNFTPRILGLVELNEKQYAYKLFIFKSFNNNPGFCMRQYFYYETAMSGLGHCMHTYSGDGNPLPSFDKEPYIVPLFDDISETATFYWNTLNKDNKISIFVKFIDLYTTDFKTLIINKNQ